MAFVLSLLMALVLVSYSPGGSLGCDLSQNHVLFGRKNLRLLGEMRRISPRFCLQDRKEFAFPQEMVDGGQLQEAQAISVLHEMLQQSFNLFHTERSSAAWDTTLLSSSALHSISSWTTWTPAWGSMASENLPQGSTRHRLSQPSSSCIFPMAFVLSLLMALVLVSYGPGGSLGCDLSQNHVLVGRKNLRLLGEMRRISPRFCLQDRKDFDFPQEIVEGSQLKEAQALSVLHEMLQQSFNLFHPERSSAAWDTILLEQLRAGLHQQLDDLDACLGQVMGEEDSALGRTGPTLAVKRYFQGIHVYLQEKEYSDCAWETIRVEIMRSLSSSASLHERLRMMDGDLNSP
ncbi:hypothetical protein MJT46_004633 [Ovis ammon polii x Ovis aries]|nr:hypothetical protein MJT46_004633 [Ovis ammon polii x Ovis aries]